MKFLQKVIAILMIVSIGLLPTQTDAYPAATASQPFYMGVYMYDYALARVAKEQNQDYSEFLEEHLKILQANGVNAVYFAGVNRERFDQNLKLFAKYGISIVPQLDFAYYQPNWNDKQISDYAKIAADFINKYADEPNILAFSVREEIPHSGTNGLARYYAAILAQAPKARFQLINNNLGSATDLPVPDPVIMGTDRYAFWWESSGGGYLASPGFSLNWVRQEADRYYWQSARRGAEFSLVVTQGGAFVPASANKIAGDEPMTYPKTKEAQEKLRQRVRQFAADGRMGWGEFDTPQGKRYNVWKYYRLPENCMRALAWTSVLEGGTSFYIYSYTPPGEKEKDNFKQAALAGKPSKWISWTTLAGRPGVDNSQLAEFAEASREIRAYEGIITRMRRTGETLIQSEEKDVFHNAFMLPNFSGRVVVLQNSNVGTWPGNSARMFKDSDDVRIDDNGNLVGYKGFDKPLDIHFTLANKEATAGVFDVRKGQKLTAANAQYTTSIAPGSGTLLFIGNGEEAKELHEWLSR